MSHENINTVRNLDPFLLELRTQQQIESPVAKFWLPMKDNTEAIVKANK